MTSLVSSSRGRGGRQRGFGGGGGCGRGGRAFRQGIVLDLCKIISVFAFAHHDGSIRAADPAGVLLFADPFAVFQDLKVGYAVRANIQGGSFICTAEDDKQGGEEQGEAWMFSQVEHGFLRRHVE